MAMEMIELSLPLPPNPNAAELRGRHWATRARLKRRYFAEAYARMREQDINFPSEPWKRARVDCEFRVWNLLDEDDNLPVRRKWILDFLTCDRARLVPPPPRGRKTSAVHGSGFIVDDSPRTLERGNLSQCVDRRQGGQGVDVLLWRLA